MGFIRYTHVLFTLALSTALLPSSLEAQVLYGSITGNVTDKSGLPITVARIEALDTGTGALKQTNADSHGAFMFNDLQPGVYKVTISAPSFGTSVHNNISVDANTARRVDVALDVSQVNQSVTVDASAVTLQADRVEVNTQISDKEVEDLPLTGARNFQSLLDLVPGVSPPVASHSEAGNPTGALATNVNGSSYNNNGTRIDGAVNGYPCLPEINAYVPPAESIQAVSVSTGNYDAEQGMAGGSAVNVSMKSGTNSIHGAAWEYNTVSKLNAKNFFYRGGPNLPKFINNQFGLTNGGPIKKNKIFYFADWERTLKRQAASGTYTVPNDKMRAGDFTYTTAKIYDPTTGTATGTGRTQFPNNMIPVSRQSFAAITMAALFPEPNMGTVNATSANYFGVNRYYFNRDNIDIKVNYNPNDKSSAWGRYSVITYDIFDPPQLGPAGGGATNGGQPGDALGTVRNAATGGTYTITPSLLVDGNVGYTRQTIGCQDVDINKNWGSDILKIPGTNGSLLLQGGMPNFSVSSITGFGNTNVSNPFVFRDNQYTVSGNVSWIKRSHNMRFGMDYVDSQINHFQPQLKYGARGGFAFTGGVTSLNGGSATSLPNNSWADFMLGLPQAMGKDYQYINPGTVREKSFGLYARDQWQVLSNLTVTLGVRYEDYPLAHRDHTGFNRYDATTNLELIGGQGGVPFDTGMDIGHGIFAPRLGIAYRIGQKTVIRTGYGITVDPNNFRTLRDAYPAVISQQLTGPNSYSPAGSLVTGLPAVIFPDITQGKLVLPSTLGTSSFPQTVRRGYIESYNFTIQRDLGHGFNLQAGYVGTMSIRQFASVNINASTPNGGNAGEPLNILFGNISTIGMLEPFNSSRYNSLQSTAVKRFRGGNSVRMSYTFGQAIDYNDNSDSGLTWNWVPMLQRNKALASYDRTHNLKFYGTYDLPFGRGQRWLTQGFINKLVGGWQINGIMAKVSGTPFTVAASGTALNSPGGNQQTANQVLPTVDILNGLTPYFDTKAFVAPTATGVYGNTGRNILRGPGYFNLDASVFRNFRITERFKLQFRTEAFGATNTPHFSNPAATVGGGFGNITASSGQRQLRFAAKLTY